MPWKRRGGSRYYYRSVRVAGRVLSVYQGGGEIGSLSAEIAEFKRATRRRLREADLADVEDFRKEQEAVGLDDFIRRVEGLARAALEVAGYHRHKRGEWRKRRMPPSSSTKEANALAELNTLPQDEVGRRIKLAEAGDPQCLDWMRQAMEADPTGRLAGLFGSDPAEQISKILIRGVAKYDSVGDPLASTALQVRFQRMREQLAGPEPSALERLLSDRVALSWLSLHALELQYESEKHALGPALAEAMERRLARLNRQFNEACKTLSVVRRLAVPVLQVMLAEQQQVNFGSRPSRPSRTAP